MGKHVLIFFLSLVIKNSFGQITFQKAFGDSTDNSPVYIQQTADSGYMICDGADLTNELIRLNKFGDTLWTKSYSNSSAVSSQNTNDGGYIILSGAYSPVSYDYSLYLIKTNSEGDTLWTKMYSDSQFLDYNGYGYEPQSIQQTMGDNGYVICFNSSFGASLIKTDTHGNLTWAKAYSLTYAEISGVQVRIVAGGYIVIGSVFNEENEDWDVYLIKTDDYGNVQWAKSYGGSDDDEGNSVQQTSDGGYIVVGQTSSFGAGGIDVYLIKTDNYGNALWSKTYGGTDKDVGYDVEQTKDGGYVISGETKSFGAGIQDVYLIKTDESGNLLWSKVYGGSDHEYGRLVHQTNDAGYIVGGYAFGFGPDTSALNIYVIKTDSTGKSVCSEMAVSSNVGNASTITGYGGASSDITYSVFTNNSSYVYNVNSLQSASVCEVAAVNEEIKNNAIAAFPNPVGNQLTLLLSSPDLSKENVSIMNILGQVMLSQYFSTEEGENETSLNVSVLSPGIYFVRIFNEHTSWAGRFVKE